MGSRPHGRNRETCRVPAAFLNWCEISFVLYWDIEKKQLLGLLTAFDKCQKLSTAQGAALLEDIYSETWGEVLFCLDCVTMWAVRYTLYGDRAILKHLHALLLYGHWEAGPLDLEPHRKLLGYFVLPAVLPTWDCEWEAMLDWAMKYLRGKLTTCRKLLSVLAWHLSMRQGKWKDVFIVRQAARALRRAARQRTEAWTKEGFAHDAG